MDLSLDKKLVGWLHSVTVNGLKSKWRTVTSGVPRGSILGLAFFNISVGDMDSRIDCILSEFANVTKRDGFDILEGRDVIQRDHYRLERWSRVNLMKFNKAKCEVLLMVWGNPSLPVPEGGLHARGEGLFTRTGCTEKFWLPPPWKCSRPVWMGFWVTHSSGRHPYSLQGGCN